MPLNIETFSNAVGGNAFYKAITHPLAAEPARALLTKLRAGGPVAIYDPHNLLAAFDALFPTMVLGGRNTARAVATRTSTDAMSPLSSPRVPQAGSRSWARNRPAPGSLAPRRAAPARPRASRASAR